MFFFVCLYYVRVRYPSSVKIRRWNPVRETSSASVTDKNIYYTNTYTYILYTYNILYKNTITKTHGLTWGSTYGGALGCNSKRLSVFETYYVMFFFVIRFFIA